MGSSRDIIDQNRPADGEALAEGVRVGELTSERVVVREVLAGVRLAHVDEDRLHPIDRELVGKIVEGWARQPTIGSGEGAELDNGEPATCELTQSNLVTVLQPDELRVGRVHANRQVAAEAGKRLNIVVRRKNGNCPQ